MNSLEFFMSPGSIAQKQYEALRMNYFLNQQKEDEG